MDVFKKIFSFLEKMLKKENDIKMIEDSQNIKNINSINQKENFIESLKQNTVITKKIDKKIKTIICSGDGTGIQKKLSF